MPLKIDFTLQRLHIAVTSLQGQGFIDRAKLHAFPLTNPRHTRLLFTILLSCLTSKPLSLKHSFTVSISSVAYPLSNSIITTFLPFSFNLVQWNTHSRPTLSKATLHSLQIQSTTLSPAFYHLSCDLILTRSLSLLKFLHSPNRLSSEVVASPKPIKATHVYCNLFLGIYIL